MKTAVAAMLRNRKGFAISYKMIMWIPRFIFTVLVLSITFYVILSFIKTATNVSEAESNILTDAAYYSGVAFSYADPSTGRVYTGVIDPSNFNDAGLKKFFDYKKPLTVGRFVKKQNIIDYFLSPGGKDGTYTDKARYEFWQPIAQAAGKGEGGKTPYAEVRYVATADGKGAVVETVFIASN